jgi:hypothetical protein
MKHFPERQTPGSGWRYIVTAFPAFSRTGRYAASNADARRLMESPTCALHYTECPQTLTKIRSTDADFSRFPHTDGIDCNCDQYLVRRHYPPRHEHNNEPNKNNESQKTRHQRRALRFPPAGHGVFRARPHRPCCWCCLHHGRRVAPWSDPRVRCCGWGYDHMADARAHETAEHGHMTTPPNKPDAVNPAIASQLHSEHHWRGVTDPERSPQI